MSQLIPDFEAQLAKPKSTVYVLVIFLFSFRYCRFHSCYNYDAKKINEYWISPKFSRGLPDPRLPFHSPSTGWLHVYPRWRSEHPREQENWLSVQDLACCAQPAGTLLGEAPQGLSSPDCPPHHAAAQPGPHTGAH